MTIEQGWDEANDHQDDNDDQDPAAPPAAVVLDTFGLDEAVAAEGGLAEAWAGYRIRPERIPDGQLRELWREAQALTTLAEGVRERLESIGRAFNPFFGADDEAFAAWAAGRPVEGTDPGPARSWSSYLPSEAGHPGYGAGYLHARPGLAAPAEPEPHEHHFAVVEASGGEVDFADRACGTTFDEDRQDQAEREYAEQARRA